MVIFSLGSSGANRALLSRILRRGLLCLSQARGDAWNIKLILFSSQHSLHTRNIGKVLWRCAGQGGVSHVDQEGPLVHNLGAARRGAEHGAPGGGGVVSRHVLLTSDHHSPGV